MKSVLFPYTETRLEDCPALIERLGGAEHQWHHHVLSPGCRYNPRADQYALLIEDATAKVNHMAFSTVFPEVNKDLIQRQFGDSVFDPGTSRLGEKQLTDKSRVLAWIKTLQERGKAWHHHLLYPECVLNSHPGLWAISVEEDEPEGDATIETYQQKPVDILREIEVLYFKNLEARGVS